MTGERRTGRRQDRRLRAYVAEDGWHVGRAEGTGRVGLNHVRIQHWRQRARRDLGRREADPA